MSGDMMMWNSTVTVALRLIAVAVGVDGAAAVSDYSFNGSMRVQGSGHHQR